MKPVAIVLHLMDGTLSGTDSWFHNPSSEASTHYGVGVDGEVYQWVDETDEAWGNGRVDHPTWKLIQAQNPNFYTVSIEHEGVSGHVWTDAQYAADAELIKQIAARWGIPLDRDHVIGHNEIYSLKPDCPGKGLDFGKLMGMLVQAPPQAVPVQPCSVVKGDASPACYWVDGEKRLHLIPNWAFYEEYFGSAIQTLSQSAVDGLAKGKSFV